MGYRRRGAAVVAWLLLNPGLAAAEGSFAAGYSLVGAPGGGVAPIGWFASVARRMAGTRVWAVGEAAGAHSWDGQLITLGGGVRLTGFGNGPRPFAQLLGTVIAGNSGAPVGLFIEPGAGVDLPIRGRVSFRIGTSLPCVVVGEATGLTMIRLQLGLAIPFSDK